METALLNEIIDCLPKDRTVFRYARDDYALMLLSNYAGEGKRIADIKQSAFRGLLDKPAIKQLVASCGMGSISQQDLNYASVKERQNFILSVGKWDATRRYFSQTTTNSANLVLQVNFNSGHDTLFNRLIGCDEMDYFRYEEHPILKKGERRYYRNTLGWARIDMDFDTGEALIEEIQNDWLRRARRYQNMMMRYFARRKNHRTSHGFRATPDNVEQYVNAILGPVYRIWDEAILTAAIKFCIEELGINCIYYHTFDTGNRLKNITWRFPPQSLYTDLPRKFCFEKTGQVPQFLAKSKVVKRKLKKVKNPHWYALSM